MEKVVFGGAMLVVFLVLVTFVVSIGLFIKNWFMDGFKRGYDDAMKSE